MCTVNGVFWKQTLCCSLILLFAFCYLACGTYLCLFIAIGLEVSMFGIQVIVGQLGLGFSHDIFIELLCLLSVICV